LPNEYRSLVTVANPRSPISEAYRALRTNIQFSSIDRSLHSLLVTSTSPEEGKSTVLANLAVTFAEAGSQVILVDADLRRPSLHVLFGLSNQVGLTTAVLDDGGALPIQDTPVPNLRLLTSGPLPPNPAELLGSQRMDRIIEGLRAMADYVLFDSPPIVAVTDAAVLGRRLDGVLLVVDAGKTKRDHARRAKALLEKVNAHLLGVVLNNAELDLSLYQYYAEQ